MDKCSPKSSNWDGYNANCCTADQQCGELHGGCTSDDHCGGYLVCSASPSACNGFDTASGEHCCHFPGTNNYKIK